MCASLNQILKVENLEFLIAGFCNESYGDLWLIYDKNERVILHKYFPWLQWSRTALFSHSSRYNAAGKQDL